MNTDRGGLSPIGAHFGPLGTIFNCPGRTSIHVHGSPHLCARAAGSRSHAFLIQASTTFNAGLGPYASTSSPTLRLDGSSPVRRVLTPLSLFLGGFAIGILPACKSDSATSETTGGDEVDINVGGASPETDPVPSGEPESPEYPQIKSLQGPVQAALGQILTFVVTSDFEPEGEGVDMAVVLPDESIWFKVPVAALPAPNSSPGKWQYSVTVALGSSQALAGSSIKLEFALMNPGGAGG